MEILDGLIVKWKKASLKQKIIVIAIIVFTIILLSFNKDFFSHNKIESKGNFGTNNTIDKMDNSGNITNMIKNNGSGDTVLGDKIINKGDEEEIEEFTIKVLNSSYDNLTKAILYEGNNCAENKKIKWKDEYDNVHKEYTFYMAIKKNRKKKMSITQENYLCENFIIEQSNQNIKPIRLKINCNSKPKNNECLVREE